MAESSDQTALQRRATWVGLRTLRQRPKMVGETRNGDPVFEVRSVRLVLREDAGHFSRLAECSKCGREVPGAPVMSPADLDRPPHSVICKDCVRASVAASPLQPERRPVTPKAPKAPATEPENRPSESIEPADDARFAAMELQLQEAMSRLAELADVQRDESTESRLEEALRKGLADIRAQVLEASEGSPARTDVEALAQLVQAQQRQLVSLSAVLDETRAEVKRLAESDPESRTAQAGTDVAGLEERLRGDVTTLTRLVETLRGDIEGPLGTSAQNGMAMVVQAIQELARGRDEVKASVEDLLADAGGAQARADALASAIEAIGGRLQELELRMEKSIDGLSAALDDYRRELRPSGATNGRLDRTGEATGSGTPTPGELLDGLERQLQEAEGRLARLTAGPDRGARPSGES